MNLQWLKSTPWYLVYEGEGEGTGAGEGTGTGEGTGSGTGTGEGNVPKTFTQEQVNAFLNREKEKWQKTAQQQVTQLEQLKKSQNLTEKQKSELQIRIDELNQSMLTKEQLAQQEREKMKKEHDDLKKSLEGERNDWRDRYTRETIRREITDEAAAADGYSAVQFVAQLQGDSRLVEVVDPETNEPTGQYAVKVKFKDTDKDGKPVILDMSVKDTVKRMKELPDFANFFKSGVTGGLGGSREGSGGRSGEKQPENMTSEEYRQYRKKAGLSGTNKRY